MFLKLSIAALKVDEALTDFIEGALRMALGLNSWGQRPPEAALAPVPPNGTRKRFLIYPEKTTQERVARKGKGKRKSAATATGAASAASTSEAPAPAKPAAGSGRGAKASQKGGKNKGKGKGKTGKAKSKGRK